MNSEEFRVIIEKLMNDPNIPDCPDFTEDEWAALCEEAPMTQDLFNRCLDKCADGNYAMAYFEIQDQFPQFLEGFERYVENEYGLEPVSYVNVEESLVEFKRKANERAGYSVFEDID